MNSFLFKLCGLALISSMLTLLVKRLNGELALLLKIASGIVLAGVCFGALSPIVEYISELSSSLGEEIISSVEFMLRVLAVAVIAHISATICRDCGENTLASYIEIGGKVEILVLSLPYISNIVEMAIGLID